ncbi:hypothetical protein ACET3Z_020503 [Daucus carota]
MEKSWKFPAEGFIKVNVHAFTRDVALPNGNDSGIGIVLRDRKGTIIKMYYGTIRNLTTRANELWALLVGLKGAFIEQENMVELETDNGEAVKEWEDWKWFIDQNHCKVIQQLEQRKSDPNLTLVVRVVKESQNRLARYLAEAGALQNTRLVVMRRLFGRVKEIWSLDMGLGAIHGGFEAMSEEEYEDWLWEAEEDEHEHLIEVVELSDDEDEEDEASRVSYDQEEQGFGWRSQANGGP